MTLKQKSVDSLTLEKQLHNKDASSAAPIILGWCLFVDLCTMVNSEYSTVECAEQGI